MQIVEFVCANYHYLLLIYSYKISYMLYDFMQDGMIFSLYGKWLRREENRNLEIEMHNNRLSEDLEKGIIELSELRFIDRITVPFWKKPLGKCLKCFHVWVFLLLFIFCLFIGKDFDFLFFITSLAISYTKLAKDYYE